MCIQWCCKDCLDKITILTHRWARERCNEYFIARSQNLNTTACPIGPWQLRRAYHRHPYRGPQMCDECKKAGRKEKKLIQSARQKANLALGQQPEYNGAMSLGELKIPESYHRNRQLLLEPGKINVMKAKWETFSAVNGHLSSHDFEREWATRFATSSDVYFNAGVSPQPSKYTPTVEQRMNEEVSSRASTTIMGEVFRNPHQQIYNHLNASTFERNEKSPRGPHVFIHYNPDSIIKWPNSTQEASPVAGQQARYQHNISSATNTGNRSISPVKHASYQTPCRPKLPYHMCSGLIEKGSRTTNSTTTAMVGEEEAPRDPNFGDVQCYSSSTIGFSSSHLTRRRPWDL